MPQRQGINQVDSGLQLDPVPLKWQHSEHPVVVSLALASKLGA